MMILLANYIRDRKLGIYKFNLFSGGTPIDPVHVRPGEANGDADGRGCKGFGDHARRVEQRRYSRIWAAESTTCHQTHAG